MLLIKAAAFRVPHLAWKFLEGGFIKSFYSGGEVKSLERGVKKDDENKELLTLVDGKAEFFIKLVNSKQWYYITFLFCQILNLVALIFVWNMTDLFLDGNFHTYGSDFYKEMRYGYKEGSDETDETIGFNVMCNAFPTIVSVLSNRH